MTSSAKFRFFELLEAQHPLLVEGSIVAELHRRNLFEYPPVVYNLSNPLVIENIHRQFVDIGVHIVLANTYQANALSLEQYRLADKVYEINRKAVWIARCAAVGKALVAGVIGPVGKFLQPVGPYTREQVRRAFTEQIIALLDGGADLLLLKSFLNIEELIIAIEAARFIDPEIPIIAQKTFAEDASVLNTDFPLRIAKMMKDTGATVIGANGSVGPQRMMTIIRKMLEAGGIFSAQPDVSIPIIRNGLASYDPDPEYIAEKLQRMAEGGVKIIGVDGGGTVEIVKKVADDIRQVVVGSHPFPAAKHRFSQQTETVAAIPANFLSQLQSGNFVVTVELDIPRGIQFDQVLEGAAYLKKHGVHAVNISDGARARLRINPIALSTLIQEKIGIETITHYACRDRNMIALQADLIGAWTLGVKNILAVTGDPAQIGDYPYATTVHDLDSIGLIRALNLLNQGRDLAGNSIGASTAFTICCACNPVAENLEQEVDRLYQKVEQGAQVVFTQPVYDTEMLENFLHKIRSLPIYLLVGILPLRSFRHAEFLHFEVPGIEIPRWVREKMQKAAKKGKEEEIRTGMEIAVDFAKENREKVHGYYLMPPFEKYEMAIEILRELQLLKVSLQ